MRDFIQVYLQQAITPLARLLTRLQISPNQVTISGFLITLVSAGLLILGFPVSAGIVFLVGSALNLVDGTLASGSFTSTAVFVHASEGDE